MQYRQGLCPPGEKPGLSSASSRDLTGPNHQQSASILPLSPARAWDSPPEDQSGLSCTAAYKSRSRYRSYHGRASFFSCSVIGRDLPFGSTSSVTIMTKAPKIITTHPNSILLLSSIPHLRLEFHRQAKLLRYLNIRVGTRFGFRPAVRFHAPVHPHACGDIPGAMRIL